MKYTINRAKRNLIILTASFLILFKLIEGLLSLFIGPEKPDILRTVIDSMLYIIPYFYIMLVFTDYFKHNKLKVIAIIIILILVLEVVLNGCGITNTFKPIVPQFIVYSITAIWFSAKIVWIILLFRLKVNDYPAISSIRIYAVGLLIILLLGIPIPFVIKPENYFIWLQLVSMTVAIPYCFVIQFAMKIPLKEENLSLQNFA